MLNSVINKTNIVEGIVSPEKTVFLPSMWNEVTKSQLNAAIGGIERSLGLAIIELKDEISESKLELRGEFQTEITNTETRLSANIASVDNELQAVAGDVQNVKAILTGNNQFVKVTSSQAYTSRVTADGANIFDDQLTPVLEIQGSTVKTTNLFDISKLSTGVGNTTTHTDRDVTVTNYYAASNQRMNVLFPNLVIGKTYTCVCNLQTSSGSLGNNQGVILCGDMCLLYPTTTGVAKISFTLTENGYNSDVIFLGVGEGSTTWANFMCLEGDWTNKEIPEWTPYFAGLKHAYINSIVSTGKNLFNENETKKAANWDTSAAYSKCKLFTLKKGQTYTIYINKVDATPSSHAESYPGLDLNFSLGVTPIDGATLLANSSVDYACNGTNKKYIIKVGDEEQYLWAYLNGKMTDAKLEYIFSKIVIGMTIALGNSPTFEPYKQSVFQLPETVELGVFDKILPQEGKIIRQIKKLVFTGDEEWIEASNMAQLKLNVPYLGYANVVNNVPYNGLCNVTKFEPDYATAGCYMTSNTWFGFTPSFLNEIGVTTPNADGTGYTFTAENLPAWKAWLKSRYEAGNPVEVVYKISDEYATTETINAPKIYTAWNGGSETIVQGETDNSGYGAMPTVTQTYFGKVGEE